MERKEYSEGKELLTGQSRPALYFQTSSLEASVNGIVMYSINANVIS